ncbi:acetoacetate-CoA ligase [Exophiala oligosperma]|uniref:Acetoacetate-CoA ligase n=1 Tax=Exophiala oligosperma TaxID=215243 RepID=A0A0D2ELD2_9EURO|nr:acetoacetate-CoA ligase [Exophiala oligosperma]KIW48689.1 acetoacetate-CoA ligase [Exophiala oligosperma]
MLVWEFTKVKASRHPSFAIAATEASTLYPPPTWFPGAQLNIAQNILETPHVDQHDSEKPVLTGIREAVGEIEHVTLPQLRDRIGTLANALTRIGVGKSDRVACIGANSIDTYTILMATAAVGAIFTCCSPELGEQGILDRFIQVSPKILFADDWSLYNGKRISCRAKVQSVAGILKQKAQLRALVFVPRFNDSFPDQSREGIHSLSTFTAGVSKKLNFVPLNFSHPFIIVYSSGTTGQPKCLVHSQGGVLIKHKLEQILCMDMKKDSVYLQYSSTNWFMHIYALLGLLSGARSILYDGSPFQPTVRRLLMILEDESVTHFGISPQYLSLLEQAGVKREDVASLKKLRTITSTGSVLHESQFHWVYRTFGSVHLMSMSGGTDIAGAFVGGASTLPVYAGWCQARTLGMKVEVYSEEGKVIDSTGNPGELVCTAPFPSEPVFFWGDPEGNRYRASYFEKYPGKWCQGDFIRLDPNTQGIMFLGRSDGVLNPSGVRFGSAEIYNCLAAFHQIEDSLCVGRKRPSDRDEQVLLFVKMVQGHRFDQQLKTAIEVHIRRTLSARHVPRLICETRAIPMTATGKKTEVPVKKIVSGQKITPSSTIANPDCLQWYEQFARPDDLGSLKQTAKL